MARERLIHLLKPIWVGVLVQVLCVSGGTLWDVPTAPFHPHTNISTRLHWEPQCQSQLRHLQNEARTTANIPPKIDGHWVSSSCEVRPGPEFLTRSYMFYQSSMRLFKALQHYYSDSECHAPAYSLVIRGKLRLRQASWITHGATESDHYLHKVGMVIHNQKATHRLATRLTPSCLGLKAGAHLVPRRFYELFNAKTEKDCLGGLGFSMMELELLRVETHHHPHSRPAQLLFLGDVHTDWTERTQHRPTSYQEPLQNALHHFHPCPACAVVYRATEQQPPVLPPSPSVPLQLSGSWMSQRCESRPAVLFLTRFFSFDEEQRSWQGTYRHYSDPVCHHPSFTLVAAGNYAQTGPSAKVRGATELVFKVTRARVNVLDPMLIRELNGAQNGTCGRAGEWRAGSEQDITWTNGCPALGLQLPHKEYELFKMEMGSKRRRLFVGARPTDGTSPDRAGKRPTSFQTALVQCGSGEGVAPRYSSYRDPSPKAKNSATVKDYWLIVLSACFWSGVMLT